MKLSNILVVFGKELKDMLRDRRTVLSMFLIPALVMPGLMFGFGALAKSVIGKAQAETATVVIRGAENAPALVEALRKWGRFEILPDSGDFEKRVADKQLRTAVDIPAGFEADLAAGRASKLTLLIHDGDMKSGMAVGELEHFLGDYRDKLVKARLNEKGLQETFVRPFEFNRRNVASAEKVGGSIIGGVIPYMFIMLSFTGAMYPALDLTAGEKERGTLETILCSPLSRLELVLGKFLMVLTASLATVVSAIVSMFAWGFLGGAFLFGGGGGGGPGMETVSAMPTISVPGLIGVVFLVMPLAILFSSLLIGIGLFAKTMKEAQSYAGPLIFIAVIPGVAAMLPGVELNAKLALIPIMNVALVSKEMVAGNFPWVMILLIFASTAFYSSLALAWAVRQFNREEVIFRT